MMASLRMKTYPPRPTTARDTAPDAIAIAFTIFLHDSRIYYSFILYIMSRKTANANTTSPNIIDVFVTTIDLCFH